MNTTADQEENFRAPEDKRDEILEKLRGASEERKDAESEGQKTKQADRLVALAADTEFFHTPEGKPFVSLPVKEHREVHPLRGKMFRSLLQKRFYDSQGKTAGGQAVDDALGVLEGKALHDGLEEPIFVRVAGAEDKIYLDMGDADWQAVEISPSGWDVISNPPVRFWRPAGMQPLPIPDANGSIEELRYFLNVQKNDADFHLHVGWLVQALRPTGPYPVLILHGEQGSAKSTTSRLLAALVDPHSAPLRSEPREVRDLMITASRSWVLAFDNLSRLRDYASDALCCLSTGGGFSARKLYSDDDEVTFNATRPIILNSIEEVARRADLLDRALIVNLPRIEPKGRKTEAELWSAFEKARPRILGALLGAVSHGLRELPRTRIEDPPRLADFAMWVEAAQGAFGWERGTFLKAYCEARKSADDLALDCAVGEAILHKLNGTGFTGTATALLAKLGNLAGEEFTRREDWPKTPPAFGGLLTRLAPHLRSLGYVVEHGKGRERRKITIEPPKQPEETGGVT